MLYLGELDTAFPRPDSTKLVLKFENGDIRRISTHRSWANFVADFLGLEVRLCYSLADEWTKTSKLVAVAEVIDGPKGWNNEEYFRDRTGNS